jgi:hypothetical protein
LGASLTVLTDLDYTLDNLQANVNLNYQVEHGHGHASKKPIVRALDWTDPSTYLQPSDFHAPAERGQREEHEGAVWDVSLGADGVWLEAVVEPLSAALGAPCSPATQILLSHQVQHNEVCV